VAPRDVSAGFDSEELGKIKLWIIVHAMRGIEFEPCSDEAEKDPSKGVLE